MVCEPRWREERNYQSHFQNENEKLIKITVELFDYNDVDKQF